jgi:hypothetical protein
MGANFINFFGASGLAKVTKLRCVYPYIIYVLLFWWFAIGIIYFELLLFCLITTG